VVATAVLTCQDGVWQRYWFNTVARTNMYGFADSLQQCLFLALPAHAAAIRGGS